MRLIYSFAIRCFSGLVFVASLLGNKKAKLWWKGRKNQWDNLKSPYKNDQWLWIHVSSLGEFEQGLPLIEFLKKDFPQYRILLTFFSPSGYESKKNFSLSDKVAYLPSDTLNNARRLIKNYKLKAAFFVKYDFWFNYMKVLKDNNIPLYYISTLLHPNQYFFQFYACWFRKQLKNVRHYFVQNEETAKLLQSIGIEDITITGDTRFDRVFEIANQSKSFPDIEQFINGRLCIIAGSSWPPDEKLLIPLIKKLPEKYCFIMAPHDISTSHVKQIENRIDDYQLYTELDSNKHSKTLIINTIGILKNIYKYARFAYIGGGFQEGIHNIQEAVVFNCPVVFGPKYRRFVEAVDLVRLGGAFSICNQQELDKIFEDLIDDEAFYKKTSKICKDYVHTQIGATEKIINYLKSKL